MSYTVDRCSLCGWAEHRFFEDITVDDRSLTYQLCKSCGLVFQSPRMSDEGLQEFYQAEYRRTVQGDEGPTKKDRRVQAGRAQNLLIFIRRHLDQVQAHLDIGSSAGTLLKTIREAYDCLSVGVEPGDAYRIFSHNRSLQVVADLDDLDLSLTNCFDLITMAHVVEHLPDPINYLGKLRQKWLIPEGHLVVEVPNLYGHISLEISHLTAFSAATLRRTLNKAGYQVLALKAHGRPRSRLIPLYLTALAKVSPEHVIKQDNRPSAHWVRSRRRLGLLWSRLATKLLPHWAWLPWPEIDED